MTIKRETLEAAASAGILKYAQIDNLLVFLVQEELKKTRDSGAGRFNAALLYSLGGVLALGAAVLFAVLAVNALGSGALLWFAVLYALCAVGIAHWCAQRDRGFIASMFALLAILLAALAVFAFQYLQGDWMAALAALLTLEPGAAQDARWLTMMVTALATGVALLAWLRLPFLVLPTALIAWVIGMALVPPAVLQSSSLAQTAMPDALADIGQLFTLVTGLTLVTLGLFIDWTRRPIDKGFAFWAYFAGLLAFCGGVMQMAGMQLPGIALFIVLQAGLIGIGMLLGRRLFEFFGGIGIALVLGQVTWSLFHHSDAFVWILTAQNLAVLALGVWWWRSRPALVARLPRQWQAWRHVRAA